MASIIRKLFSEALILIFLLIHQDILPEPDARGLLGTISHRVVFP